MAIPIAPVRITLDDINLRLSGGPMFNNEVRVFDGGGVKVNAYWPFALMQYRVRFVRDEDDFTSLLDLFYALRGGALGCQFEDPMDNRDHGRGTVELIDGVYRCVKTYSPTFNPYRRLVTYLSDDATLQVPGNPVVNRETGVVTGASGPGTWRGGFYVPVRLMLPKMDAGFDPAKITDWADVGLEEVRLDD